MVQSVTCPACGQVIQNPAAVAGVFRCGACGAKFSEGAETEKPETPQEKSASTQEPVKAGYGLLLAAAWTMVALSLGMFFCFFRGDHYIGGPGLPGTFLGAAAVALVSYGSYAIVFGLLAVAAVRSMTRLDRAASSLAWRAGILHKPVQAPRRSSLPFVLPLSVTGGLWLMIGLFCCEQEKDLPQRWSELFNAGLFSAVVGAWLFLAGLSLGEIRRFLWRMGEFGRLFARRKFGERLGLGVRPHKGVPARSTSPGLLLIALVFLTAAYAAAIVCLLRFTTDSAGVRAALALTGVGFIGLVGGTYSLFRLSLLWAEMLHQWRLASQALGVLPRKNLGTFRTIVLKLLGWLLGGVVCGVSLYVTMQFLRSSGGRRMVLNGLPGFIAPLSLAFVCWWLAALKGDSLKFAACTALFDESRKARASRPVRLLAILALAVAATKIVGVASVIGLMGSKLVLGAAFLLPVLLVGVSTVFPLLIWAALVVDLSRAAANLEACLERATGLPLPAALPDITPLPPKPEPSAAFTGEGI